MKLSRYLLLGIVCLIIIFLGFTVIGGYSLSAESAARNAVPNQDGEIVFEQKYDDRKLIILSNGNKSFVRIVERDFLLFYRVTQISELGSRNPGDIIHFSWSGSLNKNNYYDTILAAKVLDPTIKKVVISNEGFFKEHLTLGEVKKESTFYLELDIVDGYAADYLALSSEKVGNFVFRGLNEKGELVSITW